MFEMISYQLGLTDFALLFASAMLIGLAKAGISGASLMGVSVLAIAFGGKGSTGIMLPILITADIVAVAYYHRHANWFHLLRLFPWVAVGVVLGTLIGDELDDQWFRLVMGGIIIVSLCIMIWQERKKKISIPQGGWFVITLGMLSGFTTMVGNLAGSVTSLYLLTMRLPKNEFIGTSAWFFLLVNIFKLPFHFFVWNTISLQTLSIDVMAIPAVLLGAFLGIAIVKQIPEASYRWVIIISTALASTLMII